MRLIDNREIIAAILTAGMLPTLPVPGRIRLASAGTTSRPANRSRTAERIRRKLQRQAARRAAERDAVQIAAASPCGIRGLAA